MKKRLWTIVLCSLAATQAPAQSVSVLSYTSHEPVEARRPALSLRIVDDPIIDPKPIHNSGMIAQTIVAPNAVLGVGLLKAAPKRPGSGEWRLDSGTPRSRKAAVSFILKF